MEWQSAQLMIQRLYWVAYHALLCPDRDESFVQNAALSFAPFAGIVLSRPAHSASHRMLQIFQPILQYQQDAHADS
jgi:hypothetical protein